MKELSKALDARANAVREGKTFSADGILEGDVVNNVTYKVDKPRKHGLSRKDKYLSQDITEWAKHYTNKLIGQLKTSSNKSSKTWDISKYGLGAYLTGQGLDAQDIFEKYDVRNPNQPDSPRSYAQRRQLLLKHLPGYKSWLKQQKNMLFILPLNCGPTIKITNFALNINFVQWDFLISSLRKKKKRLIKVWQKPKKVFSRK